MVDELPKLPRELPGHERSGAGRGLFLASEYKVTSKLGFVLDTANGAARLLLADGKPSLRSTGRDQLAGIDSGKDSGNYGVIYHVRLKYKSSDGRGFALLMTKPNRGGNIAGRRRARCRSTMEFGPEER